MTSHEAFFITCMVLISSAVITLCLSIHHLIDVQCVKHVVLRVIYHNFIKPITENLLSVWNGKEISTFGLKPEGMKPNTNAVRRYTEILDRVIRLKQNI